MKTMNAEHEKNFIEDVLGIHLTDSIKCDFSYFSLSRDKIGN